MSYSMEGLASLLFIFRNCFVTAATTLFLPSLLEIARSSFQGVEDLDCCVIELQ